MDYDYRESRALTRTVEFPEDRALGDLYTSRPGTPFSVLWTPLGRARGKVTVPADSLLSVFLISAYVMERIERGIRHVADAWNASEATLDLAPLARLRPDDLQALTFPKSLSKKYPPSCYASGRTGFV
jgi:hypothetical protein